MNEQPRFHKFGWRDRAMLRWIHNRHPNFRHVGIIYVNTDGTWLIEEPVAQDVVYGPIQRSYLELLRKAKEYDNASTNI